MDRLIQEIRNCRICAEHLPHEPHPVFAAHPESRIVIIGQAPGAVVHRTGIPWDDRSGDNLRDWMGIGKEIFYDARKVALIPMGFCYPGKGRSGDLPPRKECAPQWHRSLLDPMKEVRLTLLIGQYAQGQYLAEGQRSTLTETVRHFRDHLPHFFVLPHPSPRNNIWQAKNPWFQADVLPELKRRIRSTLE